MTRRAIFLLYRSLQTLALPLVLIYLLTRSWRTPNYLASLKERFGGLPSSWRRTVPGAIWLHAVSVGEVLAAVPLIGELRRRDPATPLFVSVSTMAGRETAEKRLSGLVAGVFFAPLDLVWCVRRVLRWIRPSVVVVLETEIWPNLFREARRAGCGLTVVNGRISDRAFPRYRRCAGLFRNVLGLCDSILAQSGEMRERFIAIGATPETVEAGGNLKYDFQPVALPVDSPMLSFVRARREPIWVAASTSADDRIEEEDFVIAAQRGLPGWRAVIAPRKPERFDAVAAKLSAAGLRFTRRTALEDPEADVLLLDSIGELSGLFEHAAVVFMGGTIAERGGHNFLEPALFGKPVIAGPHLENFRDIERHFTENNALLRIGPGAELADAVKSAAANPGLGDRALAAARAEQGAACRAAAEVMRLYGSRYPRERCAQPAWAVLSAFSFFWRVGSARDRWRKLARVRKLPVPVVSVGNITAGGTGKTPVTIELAEALRDLSPAILTRGHGRGTSEIAIVRRGESLPMALTGDEAQLFSRLCDCPVGIGADRYETGLRLLSVENPGVLLLDDAFQHRQLARNFDVVLIDALNPFGGGNLLPCGRLREPLEGLARAGAFLITRAAEAANIDAIEATVRSYNAKSPVFRADVYPKRWVNQAGEACEPEEMNANCVAFCGLGNPASFWRSLDRLGVHTAHRFEYGDHHRYSPAEMRRLARYAIDIGIQTLATTAKDSVNLCREYIEIISPLKLYWLEIGIHIERRAELIELISRSLVA